MSMARNDNTNDFVRLKRYALTNAFIKLDETRGIIENISNSLVEISSQPERGKGVVLYPGQTYKIRGVTYAAGEPKEHSSAAIAVEGDAVTESGGGSSSSDTSDITPALDNINATLQLMNTSISNANFGSSCSCNFGGLASEATHERIADALESLAEKDFGSGNGLSAYEVALGNGFKGTVQEWLESLKGEQGEKGDKGEQGNKGDPGQDGTNGLDGITPKFTIGTVTSGSLAAASITGTSVNPLLNLTLPKGDKGDKGDDAEYLNEIDPIIPDTAWAKETEYKVNNLVGYNGNVYICAKEHTSGNDFDADFALGYWLKTETPKAISSNGGIGYVQALAYNVTGTSTTNPYVKSLTINSTNTFVLPPIEVLEEAPGESKVINDLHFDNADASDFDYNKDYVTFDGTMRLKTTFPYKMSDPQAVTVDDIAGFISISNDINFGDYAMVEEVTVE